MAEGKSSGAASSTAKTSNINTKVSTMNLAVNGAEKGEHVRVVVRARPLNSKEKNEGCSSIVDANSEMAMITLNKPKSIVKQSRKGNSGGDGHHHKSFTFDAVYSGNMLATQLYEEVAYPIVEGVLEGYNGCIFAYGQTGSGKSHTMEGNYKDKAGSDSKGIIPHAFEHIFSHIDITEHSDFLVYATYVEIYNEEIRDLLDKNPKKESKLGFKPLELKEDKKGGVYIKDVTKKVVHGVEEIVEVLHVGSKNRSVGETLMNVDSSRSHAVFSICVEIADKDKSKDSIRLGTLNMVDLAGSERQSKTQAEGKRLKEACKINLSLSALGNVISALVEGRSKHVPYRDSKLTRILQNSLGGNSKTLMIATISPASSNYEETLSTLRYADRAKNIKNTPIINEDPKDALIRKFQSEIEALKELLAKGGTLTAADAKMLNLDDDFQEKVKEQLYHKDEKIKEAEYEQELLKNALEELEHKVVEGGQKAKDQELQQKMKIRKQQQKLKKQRQREAQLRLEKQKIEEEKASADSKLDRIRASLKEYKGKYEDAQDEIDDLKEEFESERYDFLMTIRKQEKELQFYKQVAQKFIHADFLVTSYGKSSEKLREMSQWDEDKGKWKLPPLKNTSSVVKLPGLEDQHQSKGKSISSLAKSTGGSTKHKYQTVNENEEEGPELFNEDGTFSPALLNSVNEELSGNSYSDASLEGSYGAERSKGKEGGLKKSIDSSFWAKASQTSLNGSIAQERKLLDRRNSKMNLDSHNWYSEGREREVSSPRNCTGDIKKKKSVSRRDSFWMSVANESSAK
eukprot:Nk52_evm24s221 gene=Nk52_evmTU24s221